MHGKRLLAVDDDDLVLTLLTRMFAAEGLHVVPAMNVRDALQRIATETFDVVVLDILLPDGNGIDCCRRIRESSSCPIVMLTARQSIEEKVAALDAGADDYVVKPFDAAELTARVRAHIRRAEGARSAGAEAPSVTVGPLTLDRRRRDAVLDGKPLGLTHREFEVLLTLSRTPGATVPKEQLLGAVWGVEDEVSDKLLAVTIHRLRQKIEADPAAPARLVTVRGVGYRLSL